MTVDSFCMPTARLLPLLREGKLTIVDVEPSPAGITQPDKLTAQLSQGGDSVMVQLKWKGSAPDGDALNNSPRKELAAFALQTLLFDEAAYPVPPTVARCLPEAEYAAQLASSERFDGTACLFGVLTYWLQNVSSFEGLDTSRFVSDAGYRRHVADFNVFTYLIDHRDSRASNFLESSDRMFSIDNGIAFGGAFDARVTTEQNWGRIVVPQLSRDMVSRLRALDAEELHSTLGVVGAARAPRRDAAADGSRRESVAPQRGARRRRRRAARFDESRNRGRRRAASEAAERRRCEKVDAVLTS